MCRSWRANKTCSRKDSGRPCSFDHPADYALPPDDCCRNFFRTGNCNYGSHCKFTHTTPQQHKDNNRGDGNASEAQPAASVAAASSQFAAASQDGAVAQPAAAAAIPMVPTAPFGSSSAVDEEMKQDSAAAAVRHEEAEFQTPTKAKQQCNKRKLATSTGLEQQPPDVVSTANSFASLEDDPPRTPLRTSSLSTLPSPARRQSSGGSGGSKRTSRRSGRKSKETQQGNTRSRSGCRFSSGGIIACSRQLGDHAYLACTIPLISILASRSQSAASSLHDPSSPDGSSSFAPAPLRLGTLNIGLGVSRKLARVMAGAPSSHSMHLHCRRSVILHCCPHVFPTTN
jgi:hypothetical protein